MKYVIQLLFLLTLSFDSAADLGQKECAADNKVHCEEQSAASSKTEYTLSDEVLVWLAEGLEHLGYVSAYSLAFAFDEGTLLPRDPQRSFKWFQKCAAQGDLDCKNNVGWYYRNGHGVDQNIEAAKAWFELAAKQGHVLAQANLADLYYLKDGLELDYELALRWYMKAAEQGEAYSQDTVGVFLQLGLGLEPNPEGARNWFRMAAAQGYTNAYVNLGRIYFYGRGVMQDFAEGVRWFSKASLAGDPAGHLYLAAAYIEGKGVQKNVSKAVSLTKEAVALNYTPAFNSLGLLYLEGLGVPFDPEKAKELFVQGAELGDGLAHVNLASLYEYGSHVPRDDFRAMMLYRLGAETGEPFAQYILAKKLMNSSFPGDYDEGMTWLESAAELGDSEAQFHLSTLLVDSTVQDDIDRAVELAHLSANAGNLGGKSMVAWLNDAGISGLRDKAAVVAMYHEGAAKGDAYSIFQLGVKMLYGDGIAVDAAEGVRLINLSCADYYYPDACRFARGNDSFYWHLIYAEQGVLSSQQLVGSFYEHGHGVTRDLGLALKWYTSASERGDAIAKLKLSWFYQNGVMVEQNKEKSFQYALESAKLGNLQAYIVVYDLYITGNGVNKDVASGLSWLSAAVDKNYPNALAKKAHLLMSGLYLDKDERAAFQLYKRAADGGDHYAALNLAILYAQGTATDLSYGDAVYWFSMITNSRDKKVRSNALYNLGYLYQEGFGVEQDLSAALDYYVAAADLGNSNAQTNIGNLYRDGRGVELNAVQAEYWYTIAVERGYPEAANELALLLEKNNTSFKRVTELYQMACKANYGDSCERLQSL